MIIILQPAITGFGTRIILPSYSIRKKSRSYIRFFNRLTKYAHFIAFFRSKSVKAQTVRAYTWRTNEYNWPYVPVQYVHSNKTAALESEYHFEQNERKKRKLIRMSFTRFPD